MNLIHGRLDRINLSSSFFRKFIENDSLYIDKTRFIENVLDDPSDVLLFARLRRTGKSLNMDMLRTFLDCKEDSAGLFTDLYISQSPYFSKVKKYPVIYLNFKDLRLSDYKAQIKDKLEKIALRYLGDNDLDRFLTRFFDNPDDYNSNGLQYLTQNIHEKYGIKSFVIIDEYDNPIMDNIAEPQCENMREWLSYVFESALKDNAALEKAVLTGVTRISQEGMFSKLNNLKVYDIFTPSVYDDNFSMSEAELTQLITGGEIDEIRRWYNNMRVGNEKLYNLYSVMTYISCGKFGDYWGQSGIMNVLARLLNQKRLEDLIRLLGDPDSHILSSVEPRLIIQDLFEFNTDEEYYSLAIQSGYLTYNVKPREGAQMLCDIYVPNLEMVHVWNAFILKHALKSSESTLREVFENIAQTGIFDVKFKEFIDMRLSYFDLYKNATEKAYHVFVLGMFTALNFHTISNMEAGTGRYDISAEGRDFSAVIEFKKSKTKGGLATAANTALRQIDDRQYYLPFINGGKPVYKIGIGVWQKSCAVKTVAHK
jgi:hypothetical protein